MAGIVQFPDGSLDEPKGLDSHWAIFELCEREEAAFHVDLCGIAVTLFGKKSDPSMSVVTRASSTPNGISSGSIWDISLVSPAARSAKIPLRIMAFGIAVQ
jgi:hypothetical protein